MAFSRSKPFAYARLLACVVPFAGVVGCGPIAFQGNLISVDGNPPAPPVAEAPKRVEVVNNKIAIGEKVQFEFNKAVIRPESYGLLDEVAKVIKENPQIKKIRVDGHASAEGSDAYNLHLSKQRAKAVADYLSKKGGVEKGKLSFEGYGAAKPIASNDDPSGREQNRRVEFSITDQVVVEKKIEIDSKGEKKVVEEKTVEAKEGT